MTSMVTLPWPSIGGEYSTPTLRSALWHAFSNTQEGPNRCRSAPIADPLFRGFGIPNRSTDPLVQRAGTAPTACLARQQAVQHRCGFDVEGSVHSVEGSVHSLGAHQWAVMLRACEGGD